jgi:hypothetical protein
MGSERGLKKMTVRLIDADRLKKSFEANTPIAFQDCVPGIHSVIDLEHTVDAIPIEWIKKWMDRQDSWNREGVITLMRDWNEGKKNELLQNNVRHGRYEHTIHG